MGSLLSSNRDASFRGSMRFYEIHRSGRRRSEPPVSDREKRSSANRPVLRLQVKPETIEREARRRQAAAAAAAAAGGSGSGGSGIAGGNIHLVSREMLRGMARESGAYDHLIPRSRSGSLSASRDIHHLRRHSVEARDSMVVVQFVDNGELGLVDGGKNEYDYDKLLPPGEFDHLCTCTYGRVPPGGDGGRDNMSPDEDHLTAITIGKNSSNQAVIQSTMTVNELRERILQHIPPESDYSRVQRSRSTNALSAYGVRDMDMYHHYENQPLPRRLVHSTSCLDDETSDDDRDWTLGESIMKTLSKGDIHLFDIDNPTHESEREVHRVWPELKTKMKKWRQSQQHLDRLDETESGFSESTSPSQNSPTSTLPN